MASRLFFLCMVCCAFSRNAFATRINMEPFANPMWYIEGRPWSLTCVVQDNQAGDPVQWLKDGYKVDPEKFTIVTTKTDIQFKWISTLTKAVSEVDDMAHYTCKVGHDDVMKHVEMFSVFTKDSNVTESYETVLECSPQSDYDVINITWFRDGFLLDSIPDLKDRLKYGEKNETVSISDSKLTDSGIYTCQIEMNADVPRIRQVFLENVTAMGKPFIRDSETPEKLQHVTNTSADLECPAGGQPPPQIFWFRGDEVLEPSARFVMTSLDGVASGLLRILNLTSVDMGQYKCTAENSRGKATVEFEIGDPGNVNSSPHLSPGKVSSLALMLALIIIGIFATSS